MHVLRWLLGGVAALAAIGTALSFAVYIASGIDAWLARAKVCRGWLSAALLLWFNIEIWRRVLLTLIHWNG